MFPKTLFTSLFLLSYLLPFTTSFRNLPMGSNSSTLQLQKRQFTTVYCGSKIGLRDARYPTGQTRTCTLGFAVKRVRGKGSGRFDHGYLTLADCITNPPRRGGQARTEGYSFDVMYGSQDLVIGKTSNSQANVKYDPIKNLDYVTIKITEPKV